jgi:hypothetical protein
MLNLAIPKFALFISNDHIDKLFRMDESSHRYLNIVTTRGARSADQRAQSCGSGYGPRITSESGCGSLSRVLKTNKTEEKNTGTAEKKKIQQKILIFYICFRSKIAIYFCPSYRRSLQFSKEHNQQQRNL